MLDNVFIYWNWGHWRFDWGMRFNSGYPYRYFGIGPMDLRVYI